MRSDLFIVSRPKKEDRVMPAGEEMESSEKGQKFISKLDLQRRNCQTPNAAPPKSASVAADSNSMIVTPLSSLKVPSMLASLIWNGQWPSVVRRLATYPHEAREKIQLPAFPNSDISITAFPIHLACARRPLPPTTIINDLLAAHPEACKQATGSPLGMLPLHLVADLSNIGYNGASVDRKNKVQTSLPAKVSQSSNHAEIVALLLQHFPESVLIPETISEMLPLHVAAATFKAENDIDLNPSAVPRQVFELLVDAGPPQVATKLKDRFGLSPMDWAWRNALHACPTCSKTVHHDAIQLNTQQAIYMCTCKRQQTGNRHPMLQSVIRSHLLTLQPTIREVEHDFITPVMPTVTANTSPRIVAQSKVAQRSGWQGSDDFSSHEDIFRSEGEARDDSSWTSNRHVHNAKSIMRNQQDSGSPKPLTRSKRFKELQQLAASVPSRSSRNVKGVGSSPWSAEFIKPNSPSYRKNKISDSINFRSGFRTEEWKESNMSPGNISEIAEKSLTMQETQWKDCNDERHSRDDNNAILCLKLRLSGLVHPSRNSRTSNNNFDDNTIVRVGSPTNRSNSNNVNPNPCFEIFVAHRAGISKGYYKSYPMYNVSEGTWEEAFIDIGLTRHQLHCGIDGAGHVEIGIRVMHCPNKGSEMKIIGTSQISLETLEKTIIESKKQTNGHEKSNWYPILQGYQVKGWLQVVSFRIQ
jgi:hypothetical protein